MPLTPLLKSFAKGTTMHGVPKAIRSHTMYGRVFWSGFCLIATIMFSVQFAHLLRKYYAYRTKVTLEVVPSNVKFPDITLCNMRHLDNMVIYRLNKIFKTAGGPRVWLNATTDEFTRDYIRSLSKYYGLFHDQSIDISVFQTVISRTTIATNINFTLVAAAGVPFKEFIVTCHFGSHGCNRMYDFHYLFDSYFYNCFTYVSPKSNEPYSSEGIENAWSTTILAGSGVLGTNDVVRLIPGMHEGFSALSNSEGVRVVIHPPGTKPFPSYEGFDVPPGYSASFGLKARENIRVKPPHGNCVDFNPLNASSNGSYRLIECQKLCVQRAITRTCRCKEISLPGYENYKHLKFCSDDSDIPHKCANESSEECRYFLYQIYNRFICVQNTSASVQLNATKTHACGCFPPCYEFSYDVAYSLSKWPADGILGEKVYIDIFDTEGYPGRFTGPEDQEKFNLYGNYFDYTNRHRAMKDFARLNVYIADGNVLKTQESEDYTVSQLLSDIGGQLGLWVGISVITLAEMIELIIDVIRYIFKSHTPHTGSINLSLDPENGIITPRTKQSKTDNNQGDTVMIVKYERNALNTRL